MTEHDKRGALVISLDFEMHWGVRDHTPASGPAADQLVASRAIVTTLADLFARRDIRATWATVGLLFASTGAEAEALKPRVRPGYHDAHLDPYGEPIGVLEEEDPLHLAGSLVERLSRTPGQEVGSHTFSHYYCLERGADAPAFRADLEAAQAAAARYGLHLTSLVLPRNQWRGDFAEAVLDTGFQCYRGPQPGWANRSRRAGDNGKSVRAARFAGSYAGPALRTFAWDDVLEPSGLCNVPASTFLRPVSPNTRRLEGFQRRRIVRALREAAQRGRIVHLWWHPQNFAAHQDPNLRLLEHLLDEVDRLRTSDGMTSLTMGDVNTRARSGRRAA